MANQLSAEKMREKLGRWTAKKPKKKKRKGRIIKKGG